MKQIFVYELCVFIGVNEYEFYYINMGIYYVLYDDID